MADYSLVSGHFHHGEKKGTSHRATPNEDNGPHTGDMFIGQAPAEMRIMPHRQGKESLSKIPVIPVQWNLVNTVTNESKNFGSYNKVTVITRVSLQENVRTICRATKKVVVITR